MFKSSSLIASGLLATLSLGACAQNAATTPSAKTILPPKTTSNQPKKEIYLPADGKDYSGNDHEYSNQRRAETANIVLFWAKAYGDDPAANPDPSKRFDVQAVLRESERFYDSYVNDLKFVEKGNSVTDKYKIVIYVTYKEGGDNGTAYGGGEDNKIGVFWTPASRINKGPYGVVAHELGHSFQYLVRADGGVGLRGPMGEMTSQYQLWQVYPEWMTFENYHLRDFMKRTHLAFLHEDNAYHSPYVLEYWSNQRGVDFVGRLWREAKAGEDTVMAYQRVTGLDQKAFNDEIFDASRRFITWDMKRIAKVASPYANQHTTFLDTLDGGWYRVAASRAPQNYGYNAIKLQVPPAGTKVTLDFKGIAGADGFRAIQADKAGWRYGFVASKADGSREYGQMFSNREGKAEFVVPAQTQFLWLVVSGAPTAHWQHLSDKDATTDEQWPYQIKLSGTSPDASVLDLSKRDAGEEKAVAANLLLWSENRKLIPIQNAIKANDLTAATQAVNDLETQNAPALIQEIARVQLATLRGAPKPVPAQANQASLFLSDAKPTSAKVGWLQPTYNRVPDEGNATLLQIGDKIFARGLYAHAPAQHVYDLGGKWNRLSGSVGIQRGNRGQVGFTLRADGKEIWKSGAVKEGDLKAFDVSVVGVKSLELAVDDGGNGASSDWGVWLDPKLAQ